MNRIKGYRVMAGFTQKEISSLMGLGEVTYRNKENGISEFKKTEMESFLEVIQSKLPEVTTVDIFFTR